MSGPYQGILTTNRVRVFAWVQNRNFARACTGGRGREGYGRGQSESRGRSSSVGSEVGGRGTKICDQT